MYEHMRFRQTTLSSPLHASSYIHKYSTFVNKAIACAALWAHQRPQGHSEATCPGPLPPKVNKAVFSRGRSAFQGTPSATKLKDTSRRVGTAFARTRVPLRARSNSQHKWPKERVWGSLAASMPTFCLLAQLYSGDAERAERHEDHPSRVW